MPLKRVRSIFLTYLLLILQMTPVPAQTTAESCIDIELAIKFQKGEAAGLIKDWGAEESDLYTTSMSDATIGTPEQEAERRRRLCSAAQELIAKVAASKKFINDKKCQSNSELFTDYIQRADRTAASVKEAAQSWCK